MKLDQKILWIIGGGELQVPLIAEAKKLGLTALVTDRNPECVARPFADFFHAVDIFDIGKNCDLLFALKKQGLNLAGVLAAGIDANVTAAVLARVAGLPGVDPHAAYLAHNKAAFRRFLTVNKFPCPKWEEVSSLTDFKKVIQRIGVPFIVKNIDNSASRGTRKFFSIPRDSVLSSAIKSAKEASTTKTALVEELLEGSEQTVETLYDVNGRFFPCFITDRDFDAKNEWAVETGLRHPTRLPKETQDSLYSLVKAVADRLGIKIGAAKADIILTSKGPVILEMTTRLSGGFDCQYLVPAATGKNVLRAAILTALGKKFPVSLLSDKKGLVALSRSVWPRPGKIVSIKGLEEARRVGGVRQIFFRYKVGDTISPYVDSARRVCFIITAGETESLADEAFKKAASLIDIRTA